MYIIVIIAIVVNTINKAKKQKKKEQSAAKTDAPARQRMPASQVQQPKAKPEKPVLPPEKPAADAAPTVRVTPHDHSNMFAGSMNAETGEGIDPHDHGFEAEADMPSMHSDAELNASIARHAAGRKAPEPAPVSPVPVLSSSSITQAFVLQEILKKPEARERERMW